MNTTIFTNIKTDAKYELVGTLDVNAETVKVRKADGKETNLKVAYVTDTTRYTTEVVDLPEPEQTETSAPVKPEKPAKKSKPSKPSAKESAPKVDSFKEFKQAGVLPYIKEDNRRIRVYAKEGDRHPIALLCRRSKGNVRFYSKTEYIELAAETIFGTIDFKPATDEGAFNNAAVIPFQLAYDACTALLICLAERASTEQAPKTAE